MSIQTPESGTAPGTKGLKGGALGLVSSVVIGMASTAPAYSLAASLGLIVVLIPVTLFFTFLIAVVVLLVLLMRLLGDRSRG